MKPTWITLALLAGAAAPAAALQAPGDVDRAIAEAELELEQARAQLEDLLAARELEARKAEEALARQEQAYAVKLQGLGEALAANRAHGAHEVIEWLDVDESRGKDRKTITRTIHVGTGVPAHGPEAGVPMAFTLKGGESEVQTYDLGEGRKMIVSVETRGELPELGWLDDVTHGEHDGPKMLFVDGHGLPGMPMGGMHMGGKGHDRGGMHMGGMGHGMGGMHVGPKGHGMGGVHMGGMGHGMHGMHLGPEGHGMGGMHRVEIRVDGGPAMEFFVPGGSTMPMGTHDGWFGLDMGHGDMQGHDGWFEFDMDHCDMKGHEAWFEFDMDHGDMEGHEAWSWTAESDTCHGKDYDAMGDCDGMDYDAMGDCDGMGDDATGDCDGMDYDAKGDCDGMDDAPAACEETAMAVSVSIDDEIAALLLQLEDATAVEAVQVIEVHADGYDEVDALIAEIEAELAMADGEPALGAIDLDAELEALMAEIEADLVIEEVAWEPVVEEAVLVDVEVLDAKQERIDELEGEVAELRELVESLVRELNER